MSRILVTNDTLTVNAAVTVDDVDGYAFAACGVCDWASDPDRGYSLQDVIREAGLHVDRRHP